MSLRQSARSPKSPSTELALRANSATLTKGARNANMAAIMRSEVSYPMLRSEVPKYASLDRIIETDSKKVATVRPKRARSGQAGDTEVEAITRSTVAVVDDHPLYRGGVVQALEGSGGFKVVAEGGSKADAVAIARQYLPELLLLDLSIPGGGIEAAAEISNISPQTRIMFLTVSETESDVFACLQAGALGYVLKGISGSDLVKMAKAVCQGETIITPSLAGRLLTSMQRRQEIKIPSTDQHNLTPREDQILDCVAKGLTNKEVAKALSLTEKTVKHYMTVIMVKLRVRNRVEAALTRGSTRPGLNGAEHRIKGN